MIISEPAADLFVGFARGSSCDLAGETTNMNLGFGPASLTVMTNPKSRTFVGASLGVGPSQPIVNYSQSSDNTTLWSLRDLLDTILGWEW